MTKKIRIIIGFIICCLMINSCKAEEEIKISFKDIQNYYYSELAKQNMTNFNPFYVSENFFCNVETQLNEIMENSDYCSILIQSSINSGKCRISTLYNSKNEIYFHSWSLNGENKNCQVYQKTAKNTLKLHPQKKTIITTSDLHVLDGTTQYIIKIINRKIYYYANHYGSYDKDYKELIELFRIYL